MSKVFLLFFIMVNVSLEAYSKKVILGSFLTQERAHNEMKKFSKTSPIVVSLSKNNNFDLKVRKSGKYYIVVAEVFHDRKVLNAFLREIRKTSKGSYVSNHTVAKKTIVKKPQEIVLKEIPEEVSKIEVAEMKESKIETKQKPKTEEKKHEIPKETIEAKKKILTQNQVIQSPIEKQMQRTSEQFSVVFDIFKEYFQWTYVISFIIFVVFTYYYIKFKRIYDEY